MIVTPEGLNVFPEDVERALNAQPGVKDSAVVGAAAPGSTAERVHAILVARAGGGCGRDRPRRERHARRPSENPRRGRLARTASCRAPKARAN